MFRRGARHGESPVQTENGVSCRSSLGVRAAGWRRREENAQFFADNWDLFRNSRELFGTSRRVFVGAADDAASGREEDANSHLDARSTRVVACREAGCGAGTLRAVG